MSNTSEQIYNDSLDFFRNKKSNTWYSTIIPVINKIKDIPVCFVIKIQKIQSDEDLEYFIIVSINSSKIYIGSDNSELNLYYHREKLDNYSIEEIEKFLQQIKNQLKELKFDKLFGIFKLELYKKRSIHELGFDIFGYEWSNCTDCVVCYEKTYTKSSCSHHLCVECWSSIKNNSCPICRTDLYMDSDDEY
jgi:hypothetical protein